MLHASKLHARRHRTLRRTREGGIINRDALEESRRPGIRRGVAARFQFEVIADQHRRELRTFADVQAVPKRRRQDEASVLFERDGGHTCMVAAGSVAAMPEYASC